MDLGEKSMSVSDFSQINPQLTLGIQPNDEAYLKDFSWSGNELLQQQIMLLFQTSEQGLNHPFLYLWGTSGSGKTFLLQAICQEISKQGHTVAYLPLKLLREWDPAILDGMAEYDWLAIDDIEQIAGHQAWEEALFHLYNRMQAGQHRILFTSQLSLKILPLKLADLKSRLTCSLIFQVHELKDEDKVTTLQTRAKKCGLDLPTNVGHYILNHYARNMHDLFTLLDHLDHASLVAQRKLTIPFIKDVLEFIGSNT